MINLREGNAVDGVNGVDLTLPRKDLGRMNTDLEDTVNHETYACFTRVYSLRRVEVIMLHNLYTIKSLSSQEGPGARGILWFTPFITLLRRSLKEKKD